RGTPSVPRARRAHAAADRAGARALSPLRRSAPRRLARPVAFLRRRRAGDAPHPRRLRPPPEERQARRLAAAGDADRGAGGVRRRELRRPRPRPGAAEPRGDLSAAGEDRGAALLRRADDRRDGRSDGRLRRDDQPGVDDGPRLAPPRPRLLMTINDPFWNNVRSLFQSAAELPAPQRAAFLDRECGDAAARAEVESLLEAHDNAGAFLEQSIWELIDTNDPHRLAGTAVGPYRLVRPLGHGGMGTVFLAVRADADFDQRVAVKLVRGGAAGEELVRRFRQERQILAALEHPNIARLIDGGTTADGLPYLVMEYVDGTPIDEFGRDLPLNEKLGLFLQLCDAVQHAHRSLVIHRDLKPGNVLVTPNHTLKLLDFGIAKLTS